MKARPSWSGKASCASASRAWSLLSPATTVAIGRAGPLPEIVEPTQEKTVGAAIAPPAEMTTTPSAKAIKPRSRLLLLFLTGGATRGTLRTLTGALTDSSPRLPKLMSIPRRKSQGNRVLQVDCQKV